MRKKIVNARQVWPPVLVANIEGKEEMKRVVECEKAVRGVA